MTYKRLVPALLGLSAFFPIVSLADDLPAQFRQCAAIAEDRERLHCYDRLAQPAAPAAPQLPAQAAEAPAAEQQRPASEGKPSLAQSDSSVLSRHWELSAADKQGIFVFRPHHDNYLMGTYNPSPNNEPYRPFRTVAPNAGNLSNTELAFQLGFKIKLLQSPMGMPADFWFGYTQRSFWQAENSEASSPFRESNYQPELMAVVPLDVNLLALRMRFINLGITHQSNGQVSSLSRSWNRVYAQAGFERENFTLLARVWKRINEDRDADDNPEIVDYMGRGDVVATYRRNGHELSLLTRYNFSTDKGAAQLGWAFPLVSNLKGYVQYFSGYGYSLIDYDAHQRVLGLGVLVEF